MNEKKLFFILGHGRSGTTLLKKILSMHPRIHFFADEFNDLGFFHSHIGLYSKKGCIHYDEMAKDLAGHPGLNLAIPKISAGDFGEMAEAVFDVIRDKKQKHIIGIKVTGRILQNVDLIKASFPNAHCIHIIRDPRDVYLSHRVGYYAATSPFHLAKSWKKAVQKVSTLRTSVRHYYQLYYEDLLTQSERTIRQLCDFLGVEFSGEMLHFYKYAKTRPSKRRALLTQKIITNNFNKWQRALSRDELDSIYAGAGDVMYKHGYCDKLPVMKIRFLKRLKEYCFSKVCFYSRLIKTLPGRPGRRYRMKVLLLRAL